MNQLTDALVLAFAAINHCVEPEREQNPDREIVGRVAEYTSERRAKR
jgi:hypothetical protein